jgi:hypothetical protein
VLGYFVEHLVNGVEVEENSTMFFSIVQVAFTLAAFEAALMLVPERDFISISIKKRFPLEVCHNILLSSLP